MNKGRLESDRDSLDYSAHVSSCLSTARPIFVPCRCATPPPVNEVSTWKDWVGVPEGRPGYEPNFPPLLPPVVGGPLPHYAGSLPRRGDISHSAPESPRCHNHHAAHSPRDCLCDDDGLEGEYTDEPRLSGESSVGHGPVRLPSWSREEDWKGQEEETLSLAVTARQSSSIERDDTGQGFQDWNPSGWYSQQRDPFLSSVV